MKRHNKEYQRRNPYLVETLAITGKWVPKDGEHVLHTLLSASMETFEARLQGKRSRIVNFATGDVIVTVPPVAIYIKPQDVYRWVPAIIKTSDILKENR